METKYSIYFHNHTNFPNKLCSSTAMPFLLPRTIRVLPTAGWVGVEGVLRNFSVFLFHTGNQAQNLAVSQALLEVC